MLTQGEMNHAHPTQFACDPVPYSAVLIIEVELSVPLVAVPNPDGVSGWYRHVLALVRLHGRLLGTTFVPLPERGLSPNDLAQRIWYALHVEIATHVREDGLPSVTELTRDGIANAGTARCLVERQELLAGAPFVSVVIATRDRPESLTRCLQSLLTLQYPNYEIIVVDNAPSTTATADLMHHAFATMPRIRYVREDWPGLAAAHNRGLLESQAEIIAITDDDVVVDAHWLTEIVAAFRTDAQVACVTGMILPAELETPAQIWVEQGAAFSKGFRRRIFGAHHEHGGVLYPYAAGMFGSGANMAFRCAVLRNLGGFDPALGAGTPALGGDDLDAFFRIIAAGYAIAYEPSAFIRHFHRRDYDGLRKQAYGYGVGLFAYLTKVLTRYPLGFVARIPLGIAYVLNPQSRKNRQKTGEYPTELTRIERKGMCKGPFAYLRSRRHAARMQASHGRPRLAGGLTEHSMVRGANTRTG